MLAIFKKAIAEVPEELNSPTFAAENQANKVPKSPGDALASFLSSAPTINSAVVCVGDFATFAYSKEKQFCAYDDMYCMFRGRVDNLSGLNREYGLGKGAKEAMFIIEAYRTLRDRAPYPADQVVKSMAGSFSFVLLDGISQTVFCALGSEGGGAELFWGVADDGSVVFCDDVKVMKMGCAMSFAPFPRGCMFHSEGGLMSYEEPMKKMKAMPRVDSEGRMCGSVFRVDVYSKVRSMPRVGSDANWANWIYQEL